MRIAVRPSENYFPDGIDPLLADLRTEGVEIVQDGPYSRRSLEEELPPALWLIASFATGAVSVGFLNAMGADAWGALKRVVRRAAAIRRHGHPPVIMIELEFEDCQITLWALSDTPDVSSTLDKALDRLEATKGKDDLWYIKESDEWLTVDERLSRIVQRADPGECSATGQQQTNRPITRYGFKHLSVDNWREPDPMLEIFARLGPDGQLRRPSGDTRAQELLAPVLHEHVPEEIGRLFEVARGALLYGYFFYPLYTLGAEQLFRVAEAAVTRKCSEMGAPRSVTKSFERKLRFLVEAWAIPLAAEKAWDATRHLRNLASHPQAQTILPPGNVFGLLQGTVDQINALFDEQGTLDS